MSLRCHECAARFPAPSEETWDAGACVPVYTCPECGARGKYEDFDPAYPVFDPSIGEYVADDEGGGEHYGQDFWQCQDVVAEANRVSLAHAQKCGDCFRDCRTAFPACELPQVVAEPMMQNADSRDSAAF